MNCDDVIPLLSAFHDGELSFQRRREVADHLASCPECARRLDSLRRLSALVESTPAPEVPATLWTKVERSLGQRIRPESWSRFRPRTAVTLLLATAAAVFGGLVLWQAVHAPSHSHKEMVRVFGQFLDSYERGQADAVEVLARQYHGEPITQAAASTALRRPTVALPVVLVHHQVAQRYLLKMPCCDCVQTIYTTGGKASLVLFEHEKEQSEWFGARPMIHADCGGKACCLVQLKDGVAGTWPVDGGYVTVVGIRDVAELGKLVDELQSL